ncbi:FAD-binding oxidoreductase [Phycicoccus duodecadis]|uniref:FAD/FMN-containing dehydrogenase n=1 Tax=Phycicoccus duodecadis TaxID=173053 RepID=A0A2N3YMY2_9MICO|nr:FAD-binding oxidoreductase [Phycicoccus duodecadis]PKW28196.1 FAD/FMN-containing dehydrogenase [Phycicoccus duodecadis]
MTDIDTRPSLTTDRPPAGGPAPGPETALCELEAVLPGQVLRPGGPGWESARRGWAVNVDQQPLAVVTVQDPEDVVAAVRCAGRHGLSVSTQPVGHGATTALTGTVLLRTGALQDLDVDVERRVARVGAGVKWGTLLAALEPTGLTALAGSSPDPSVVGFTLGGGLSWFSRALGLCAHSTVAFDLVDARGVRRRISAASDPDLFWALRGGGGDFGVVLAVEVALHEAGPLLGGRLLWPLEMARPVLQAFRRITAEAPDELSLWAHLFRFPPLPELPELLRGRAFISVDLTFLGAPAELDGLLAPLRQLPVLVLDTVGRVPLSELGGIAAEPVDPMPTQEYSELLRTLDAATVDRLVDAAGAGVELPLAVVQIRHLGGALARATTEDGPNGAVPEEYSVFCLGVPVAPGLPEAIDAAFDTVRAALGEQRAGRAFFNFLGHESDLGSTFSAPARERLRRVKAETDPSGLFRSNRPV